MKTQMQHYRDEGKNVALVNDTFLLAVANGLTATELKELIARNPSRWARFSNWILKLGGK
jgi:hypothetical protein